MMSPEEWKELERLVNEVIEAQSDKVYSSALRIRPDLTREDILQPNDYPELENHPHFRYEEGVLEGVHTVAMALKAWKNDRDQGSTA